MQVKGKEGPVRSGLLAFDEVVPVTAKLSAPSEPRCRRPGPPPSASQGSTAVDSGTTLYYRQPHLTRCPLFTNEQTPPPRRPPPTTYRPACTSPPGKLTRGPTDLSRLRLRLTLAPCLALRLQQHSHKVVPRPLLLLPPALVRHAPRPEHSPPPSHPLLDPRDPCTAEPSASTTDVWCARTPLNPSPTFG